MTRPPHPDTEDQRADTPAAVSDQARKLGYEPADAPARKVAIGMGGLTLLMIAALILCGLLLKGLAADEPPAGAATAHVDPPPPHLEQGIIAHEQPQPGNAPPPPAIRRGMAEVEARGWGDAAPALSPDDAARAHAGSAQ